MGSTHGWLYTVNESLGITLINPFSGATIELPSIMEPSKLEPPHEDYDNDDDDFEVIKVILSADPASSPNDYIVTAIYSGCHSLVFIQAGDDAWTCINTERFIMIYDVTYYKGQIFAIDNRGGVRMIDVNRRPGDGMALQVKLPNGPDAS
ncbi:uncharacterized protein LOC132271772 isoform X2 [Cornus florida]|uniref:uncharacterized protein LOC132271772 isoform X2 n=1 Tax=Cornus florida TaxID=4283 RepID=UPI00289B71C1|nr:uncharacterized protein LOC132271772 isoform X2 [Cornus florida]